MVPVGLHNVLYAIDNTTLVVHTFHASQAHGRHSAAMVCVITGDNSALLWLAFGLPVVAHQTHVSVVRLRARTREKYMANMGRG